MRILLVANINSSHTRKWALALRKRNIEVGVFSLNPLQDESDWHGELQLVFYPPARISFLPYKYYYLFTQLKKHLSAFRPDVLHSHFMTNYSLLCCLTGFHPHIATAWGSDIYVFPGKGIWARKMLQYNLRNSDVVISTSKAMAGEMSKYHTRQYNVIPFGIDLNAYKRKEPSVPDNKSVIRISCFKKVEEIYRTEILIQAFELLVKQMPGHNLELLIAGDGKKLPAMKAMAEEMGISTRVTFSGWIKPQNVPAMLRQTDICVYVSANESFGVSLLEAMACGVPLVVTGTPGFLEVAGKGTALFVNFDDPADTAAKIRKLIEDPELYGQLSDRGFEHVHKYYDLEHNIAEQIRVYGEEIAKKKLA